MPLGSRPDFGDAKYAGLELGFGAAGADVVADLETATGAGFDFLVRPLATHPTRRPASGALGGVRAGPPPPPFAPSDLLLTATQWSTQVREGVDRESRGEAGGRAKRQHTSRSVC